MSESETNGAGYVFISYARVDQSFVLQLATDLLLSGVRVWLDQIDLPAGEEWDLALQRALQRSAALLVVLSPASVESKTVLSEIATALNRGSPVIPVRYKECVLPFLLNREHYVDLVSNYREGIRRCLDELSRAGVAVDPTEHSDSAREAKLLRLSLAKAEDQIAQYEAKLQAASAEHLEESGDQHGLATALKQLAKLGVEGVDKALALLASGRPDEAVSALDDAANEKSARDPQLAAALLRRAGAIAAVSDTGRASTIFERVVDLDSGDFMARKSLADLYLRTGEFARARDTYEEALNDGRGRATPYEESTSHSGLANAYLLLGRYDAAAEHLQTALGIARRVQHPVATVVALNNLACLEQARGDLERAQTLVEEAIATAESADLEFMSAECLGTLGEIRAAHGDLQGAKRAYQRSMAIAARYGRREATASQHISLASIADREGDEALAQEHLEHAQSISEAMDSWRGVCQAKTCLAQLRSKAGMHMEAMAMLQDVLAQSRANGDRNLCLGVLFELGQVKAALEDYDGAHDCFHESLELVRATGQGKGVAYMLRLMGVVEFQRGNLAEAEASYTQSIEAARSEGAHNEVVYGLTGLGAAALARGRIDRAEKLFGEALSFASEKHVPDAEVRMYIMQVREARSALASGKL